jgi:hypothetical protein
MAQGGIILHNFVVNKSHAKYLITDSEQGFAKLTALRNLTYSLKSRDSYYCLV